VPDRRGGDRRRDPAAIDGCVGLIAAFTALLMTTATPARADEMDDVLREQGPGFALRVGKYMLGRARRGTAIGPTVAGAGSIKLRGEGDGLTGEVAVGLALQRYDVPLLPVDDLLKMAAKEAFAQAIAAYQAGRLPTAEERRAIAERVLADIERRFAAGDFGGHFEPPAMKVALEVGHVLDGGSWDVRAWLGFGVSKVFVSVAPVLSIDDGADFAADLELSVPILFGRLRTHVVEPFVRAHVPVTERDGHDDRLLIGARFMLDAL
jgi:hypothetical protein